MTTSITPPTGIEPTSSPLADSDQTAVRTHRRIPKSLILLTVGIGFILAGWLVVGAMMPTSGPKSALKYAVVRKSFPVIEEAKGELKAAKTTDVKSKVEGRATIIWLIEEGSTVEEGELLVRLASDQIEERIRKEEAVEASAIAAFEGAEKDLEILLDQNKSDIGKADLELELAITDLKKFEEGDVKQKMMVAELDLARAVQQTERAELDYEANMKLYDEGFRTESERLGVEFELHESKRSVDKAKLALAILQEYTLPTDRRRKESDIDEKRKELARVGKSTLAREAQKRADVEAKRAQLMTTQNNLHKYREQKEFTEIRAPNPGLVVYHTGHRWNPERVAEGEEVRERQTIVTLPDTSVMTVSIRIHEAKTNKIKVGQFVRVEVEGIPDEIFTGKITKIAPLADSQNSWLNPNLKEYETEITLDANDHPSLKPGVTARAEIIVAELENVLAVPVQAVYGKGGLHYLFRGEPGDEEPVEVRLGFAGAEFVEVKDGISDGQEVFLAVSDAAKRKLSEIEATKDASNPDIPVVKTASATKTGGKRSGRRGGRSRAAHGSR